MGEFMTILTLDILKEMTENHFNELFIDYSLGVGRLIGYAESDEDYYYIVKFSDYTNPVRYLSAVATPIYLKNRLNNDEYDRLEQLASLNNCAKEPILVFTQLD